MAIDWGGVWTEIGKSAAIAAAIAGFVTWGTKALISQFLKRDLKAHENSLAKDLADHKERLKRDSDLALASEQDRLKHASDLALAEVSRRTQEALVDQKATSDRLLAEFQAHLSSAASRGERIRQEVERWANPILGAVRDLLARLKNILDDKAYLALSKTPEDPIPAGWSITYDYFLPSTVFLIAQYFCCVRLLNDGLRFDLFPEYEDKDDFLSDIRAVGEALGSWPLDELGHPRPADDQQIFNLQQRAIGEAMLKDDSDAARCIGFSEFFKKWQEDEAFRSHFAPLGGMLNGLGPNTKARWQRFKLMQKALGQLERECERVLSPIKRATSA
jgi:hypothetical protein